MSAANFLLHFSEAAILVDSTSYTNGNKAFGIIKLLCKEVTTLIFVLSLVGKENISMWVIYYYHFITTKWCKWNIKTNYSILHSKYSPEGYWPLQIAKVNSILMYRHLNLCNTTPAAASTVKSVFKDFFQKFDNDRDILFLVNCSQTYLCDRQNPGAQPKGPTHFAGGFIEDYKSGGQTQPLQ